MTGIQQKLVPHEKYPSYSTDTTIKYDVGSATNTDPRESLKTYGNNAKGIACKIGIFKLEILGW